MAQKNHDQDGGAAEGIDFSASFAAIAAQEEEYNRLAKAQGHVTKEQLLAIDLGWYYHLVTSTAEIDVPLEYRKILFLQTAVQLGLPWHFVASKTLPVFGQLLTPQVEAVAPPCPVDIFVPPPFDIARQTPGEWAAAADEKWKQHRDDMFRQICAWRQEQLHLGILKEIPRRRRSTEPGPRKALIEDERTAFEWAVYRFFGMSPSALANRYPPPEGYSKAPHRASRERLRRAGQIKSRAALILKDLGLFASSISLRK